MVNLEVKVLVNKLLAVTFSNKSTLALSEVDLTRTHNLVLGVNNEFIPMSEPSGKARQSEHDCEHFSRDAKGLVDNTGVKINVGVKLAVNEIFVSQRNLLKLHSNINKGFAAQDRENIIGNLAHNLSARVVILVNAMAEAHKHLLSVFDSLNESGDILHITDLLEHTEDSLIGSTMARTVKSSHSTGKTSVNIRLGRGHMTDGSSGAVELMLGVEDEKDLNSLDDLGVHAEVLVLGVLVHHVEEVLNVT